MRMSVRISVVALALSSATLSGCTVADPAPTPSAAPSSTPAFASDEEALAAAEAAYAEYQRVADSILADGGANPERLLDVATAELYEAQIDSYESTAQKGWRTVGSTVVDSVSLQEYAHNSTLGTSAVVVYGCLDVEGVDVIDRDGISVVSPERPGRSPFEAEFEWSSSRSRLLLAEERPWRGEDFCR